MILADSSVWADHLRRRDGRLATLLERGLVLMHPFVIGELALGNLRERAGFIAGIRALPRCTVASDDDVLTLIDIASLAGSGVGYVDAHLLAAARLSAAAELWTRDSRLRRLAERLGLADAG